MTAMEKMVAETNCQASFKSIEDIYEFHEAERLRHMSLSLSRKYIEQI